MYYCISFITKSMKCSMHHLCLGLLGKERCYRHRGLLGFSELGRAGLNTSIPFKTQVVCIKDSVQLAFCSGEADKLKPRDLQPFESDVLLLFLVLLLFFLSAAFIFNFFESLWRCFVNFVGHYKIMDFMDYVRLQISTIYRCIYIHTCTQWKVY